MDFEIEAKNSIYWVLKKIMKLSEIYADTDLEDEKREFLRTIFKTLYIDRTGLFFDLREPFDMLFEAVKATNCSKLAKIAGTEIKIFELQKLIENPNQNSPIRAELTTLLPG